MANRTGTYIAFDGLGETDPSKSDFKYYGTLQMWDTHKNIDFKFVDSHDKTAAVRDSSKRVTLEGRIRERLAMSKNMLVILSSKTRKVGSMLSYEIERAVDNDCIPMIIAYVDIDSPIRSVDNYSRYWPNVLSQRINDNSAKAIHVPFKKGPILAAINQFNINGNAPKGGAKGRYDDKTYRNWGLL